ncbi:MAG: HlyC/CorC family transporter [Chloracidobacterium sp.]|nr:HlyC/CorC family transporter [Chloracidobacterium sp.]
MESEIALTSIFLMVLVITATAKSALDELSDVGLRLLASDGNGSREFWRSIVAHYQQFRFTLTFGIHISIASIAILISSISNKIYPQHFLALSFAGMILTVILFRQILPMILSQKDPAGALLRLRFPLQLLWPVFGFVANLIYGALRSSDREPEVPGQSEAKEEGGENIELQALLDVGEEEGIIEENEGELIQSVIRFSDRTAGEVMTPRPSIVAVEACATLEAVRDLMIESKYSRLPVYSGQMDNVEGVIYVRDLLKYWQLGETDRRCVDIARPTYFVPETKPIDELLPEMQKAKTPMAIVINEYGGLAGLVTIEDLIEEIVGEIEDEDEPETGADEADIVEETEGVVARGHVEVGKIERRFDVELAADDFTTVAGLVINELGHLPTVGEAITFRGLRFEVLEADERRVSRVRIRNTAVALNEKVDIAETSTAARADAKRNFMF